MMVTEFNPNGTRDKAYLSKMNAFREFRINQLNQMSPNNSPIKINVTKKAVTENESETDYEVKENESLHNASGTTSSDGGEIEIENHFKNKNFKKYNSTSSSSCDTPTSDEKSNFTISPMIVIKHKPKSSQITSKSPSFQSVINKHGDVVEYALPFSEQITTDDDEVKSTETVDDLVNKILENQKNDNLENKDLDQSLTTQNLQILQEIEHLKKWRDVLIAKISETTFNAEKVYL